jgi:hypothetical protein
LPSCRLSKQGRLLCARTLTAFFVSVVPRVTLDSVVVAFDLGATAEEILQRYPSLDVASVYEVIAYVLRHRSAVDEYLAGRLRLASGVQAEIEARFPPRGIRARLLACRDLSAI